MLPMIHEGVSRCAIVFFFVSFPVTMEVNRAVQTSLENGPASTVRGHVTQHSYWFTAIWIDCVHAIGSETIFK